MGPLGRAKFNTNQCPGVGMQPQKWQKFPLFGKESPRGVEPFDQYLQLFGAFICPTILHLCLTFDMICLTGCGVTAEKPCISHLPQIFQCTL